MRRRLEVPSDRTLRERLAAGDPARADGGLTPSERSRMRASILAAAASARPDPLRWRRWALFAGAAIAAIVLVTLPLWVERSRHAHREADRRVPLAAARRDAQRTEAPVPRSPDVPVVQGERGARGPLAATLRNASRVPRRHPAREIQSEERKPIEIRFTTAAGTQIIWSLDPNFEL